MKSESVQQVVSQAGIIIHLLKMPHITLNADLFALTKVTTGSEADLLSALISKNNLIID